MNQSDAHFAGWLMCPVCKKETRHYTKDTHDSPVAKMRLIWCEDCRVVQTANGNEVCMIQNREPTQTVCQIRYKIRKSAHLGRRYFASWGKRGLPFSVILIAPICLNISMLSVTFQYSASLPLTMR